MRGYESTPRMNNNPKIGIWGKIITGENAGWFVFVQDDSKETGGFFIFVGPEIDKTFDNWVETADRLYGFFEFRKWKVEWLDPADSARMPKPYTE
jgi:hypothetical protein